MCIRAGHCGDGVHELPPLKFCDGGDFSITNQKKRFAEWSQVCRTFDTLYLAKCAFPPQPRVPRTPTGTQLTQQFTKAIHVHYELVAVFHPSKKKRSQRRQGEVAKKLSTIYHEIRKLLPVVKRAKVLLERVRFIVLCQKMFRAGVVKRKTNAIKIKNGKFDLLC